jgi:hypothetical protein
MARRGDCHGEQLAASCVQVVPTFFALASPFTQPPCTNLEAYHCNNPFALNCEVLSGTLWHLQGPGCSWSRGPATAGNSVPEAHAAEITCAPVLVGRSR